MSWFFFRRLNANFHLLFKTQFTKNEWRISCQSYIILLFKWRKITCNRVYFTNDFHITQFELNDDQTELFGLNINLLLMTSFKRWISSFFWLILIWASKHFSFRVNMSSFWSWMIFFRRSSCKAAKFVPDHGACWFEWLLNPILSLLSILSLDLRMLDLWNLIFIYATLFLCRILVEYVSRCHLAEKKYSIFVFCKALRLRCRQIKKLVKSLPYNLFWRM